MSQFTTLPPAPAASNPSIGVNGATAPTSATEVAGINPSGNLQPLKTDSSGALITTPESGSQQHVIVDSSALPTGAATSANQATEISSLATIATNTTNAATTTLQTTGNNSLATIATNTTGVATAANQTTGNSSLSTIATNTTGLATASAQTTGNTSLSTIATNTGNISSTQGSVGAGTAATKSDLCGGIYNSTLPTLTTGQQAALQSDSSGRLSLGTSAATIGSISNVSGTVSLPTGAATSALQTTGNTSLATIATNSASTGKSVGTAFANAPVYTNYGSTSVGTINYVQLIASTTNATNTVDIFDSSGQAMILAVGAMGSEVIQYYVPPGGDVFHLAIPAGSRVALKGLTGTASSGYQLLNLLQ